MRIHLSRGSLGWYVTALLAMVVVSLAPACAKRAGESYVVDGLETLQHKPVAILFDNESYGRGPAITVYEDGLVFGFQKDTYGLPEQWFAHLTAQDLAKLRKDLEDTHIERLPSYIAICTETPTLMSRHCPDIFWTTDILVRYGMRWRSVSLRGIPEDGGAPASFMAAYHLLKKFRPAGSAKWRPETIQVDMSHTDYIEQPIPWPSDVPPPPPDVKAPEGPIPRSYNYTYSVPSIYEERVRALIRSRNSRPVEVNGQKWDLYLRFATPEEEYIRRVERHALDIRDREQRS